MSRIFISHSSTNNAQALALFDWLASHGWNDVFLDLDPRRGILAGEKWQDALKRAAARCELIAIMISPHWARSQWCLAELALAQQMNKQILGIIIEPTPLDILPVSLTSEWQLVDLTGGEPHWEHTISPPRLPEERVVKFSELGLERLKAGLERTGLDANHFPWPPESDPGRSPYRGLAALDAEDAGVFLGRSGAIVLGLDALRGLREQASPRIATILGASGAGKSSFLRAGLIPRLTRDNRHFVPLPVVRPGRAAITGEHGLLAALTQAFSGEPFHSRAEIEAALAAGPQALGALLKEISDYRTVHLADGTAVAPPTLVLAVDQAEEVFAAQDNVEGSRFLALVAEMARLPDLPLILLFSIRSDSFETLQSAPELAGTAPHRLIDLAPIPAGAYGDVIRGPAERATLAGHKLTVHEPLVDALLADVEAGGSKDALPLLAFALERLYLQYGADGDLTLTEYEAMGRFRGAIEAAVEQALAKADGNPSIPQTRAERLSLLRRGLIPWLAGIDPETKTARRRVARLSEIPPEARPLMMLLVEQRLLSTDIDKATNEVTIEPAHEALLRQWAVLDGWLAEDAADLAVLDGVRRAAVEWAANAGDPEFLAHKGVRLGAAEAVVANEKFAGFFTGGDRDYLAAARAHEDKLAAQARAARNRLRLAGGLAAAAVVVGGVVGFFFWSSAQASRIQADAFFDVAQSTAYLADGKSEAAARAALSAMAGLDTTATRTAAFTAAMDISPYALAVYEPGARVIDLDFFDADTLGLLTDAGLGEFDTTTRTARPPTPVEPPNGAKPFFLADDGVAPVIVLSDSTHLAVDPDGSTAPLKPEPIPGFVVRYNGVDASADGQVYAMTGIAGGVIIRDCREQSCADTLIPETGAVGVAVAPDGNGFVIARGNGELALYDLGQTTPKRVLDGAARAVSLDWSGQGGLLAVGEMGGAVEIFDLGGDGTDPVAAFDAGGDAAELKWSPVAPILAAACRDADICLYDFAQVAEEPKPFARFIGHSDQVSLLRWNADGSLLASAGADKSVRLWSLDQTGGGRVERNAEPDVALASTAFDARTGMLAAGDVQGTIWLWAEDGTRASLPAPLDDAASVTSLAWLADGRLAAVYRNQAAALWTMGKAKPDSLVTIDNASFSRIAALSGADAAGMPLSDKTILVFGKDDMTRFLPAGSVPLDHWGIAAGPRPDTALVSYSDGSIGLRDLADPGKDTLWVTRAQSQACGPSPALDNGALSVAVSPDGKWLAATSTASVVAVYPVDDPDKPLCLRLTALDTKTVAFSPDATKIAILGSNDQLFVFDLSRPDDALVLGAPAVPEHSVAGREAGKVRAANWLAWIDNQTLAIPTIAGTVDLVSIDPADWRGRVDGLAVRG